MQGKTYYLEGLKFDDRYTLQIVLAAPLVSSYAYDPEKAKQFLAEAGAGFPVVHLWSNDKADNQGGIGRLSALSGRARSAGADPPRPGLADLSEDA